MTFSDEFTVSYQVGDAVVLELWNIDDYLLVEGPTVDGIRVVTRYDFSATNETRLASFSDALAAGNPETITIDLYNEGSGYTYAWAIRINGVAEASNGCGAYNVEGCDGDSTAAGLVRSDTINLLPNNIDSDGDGVAADDAFPNDRLPPRIPTAAQTIGIKRNG